VRRADTDLRLLSYGDLVGDFTGPAERGNRASRRRSLLSSRSLGWDERSGDVGGVRIRLHDAGAGRVQSPKLERPVLRSAVGAGTIVFSESSRPDGLGADERNGDVGGVRIGLHDAVPDERNRPRLSHKPSWSSAFCASATKRRFRTESLRSRRVGFGRQTRAYEVGENRRCQFRTTASVCATATPKCIRPR
jgi:hypothetical protein